jgi:taurine--2-oxoglutarate transaminase
MLDQLEETLMYENPHSVAAIFLETVTGTNGLIVPPDGYLAGVRALCDKYGILMVCDEVMAGLGRTGAWFAVDNWGVTPDIISMAKGLTSAHMPLGCVAVSEKIAHAFDEKPFPGMFSLFFLFFSFSFFF